MKFFKRVLAEYFAPVGADRALKQFRLVIALIVIVAAVLAFAFPADANTEEHRSPPVIPIMAAHIVPPVLYTEPVKEPELYTEESHPDEYCIALNIYYESRSDNIAGKYAVADVVLNRVQDSRFPDTVCGVIREGPTYESWATKQHADLPDEERIYYPRKNRCQFSWYCDGLTDEPDQPAAWRDAQTIAYNIVQYGRFRGITEGATNYHATYVSPSWSLVYDIIGRIGEHIFYRWT